jgi:hypothetical protein
VWTHSTRQRYRVNDSRFNILHCDPHNLFRSFPPKTPIPSGHRKSSSHPAGPRPRWRAGAGPAGALEFHVRVSNSPPFYP